MTREATVLYSWHGGPSFTNYRGYLFKRCNCNVCSCLFLIMRNISWPCLYVSWTLCLPCTCVDGNVSAPKGLSVQKQSFQGPVW